MGFLRSNALGRGVEDKILTRFDWESKKGGIEGK
jgi:hypothetical protein